MLTDEKLIIEVNNGNEAAMEILVSRYYNMVFSYIYRRIGDYHKAYDLTQDVFIKMLNNLRGTKFKEGKFQNWLLKIAVNICIDYFRSSSYKQRKNSCELEEVKSISNNVISILERKENIHAVRQALSELPDDQRDAVILKYYHEKKYHEIAEITESNESTVKSRVRIGLLKLKDILVKEDKNEGRYIRG